MRRSLAAAILALALATAAAAQPATQPAPKPAAKPQGGSAPEAAAGPNADAISKVKDFAKRETEKLAPKAGRAEKVVKDQAPKLLDKLVDFAAEATGAAPGKAPPAKK
jgi:hypothetical protein